MTALNVWIDDETWRILIAAKFYFMQTHREATVKKLVADWYDQNKDKVIDKVGQEKINEIMAMISDEQKNNEGEQK